MIKDQSIHINDMIMSIDLIQNYIKDFSYEMFDENTAIQDSVMRRLQIIAEAARRIDKSFKISHPQIPWQKINGLRNAVVHDYDDIDLQSIWDTIIVDLPALKKSLLQIKF